MYRKPIAVLVFCVLLLGFLWFLNRIGILHGKYDSPAGWGLYNEPSWSPDGSHLAFSFYQGYHQQLWVLDIQTGQTRQLPGTGSVDFLLGIGWQDNCTVWYIDNGALYKTDIDQPQPTQVVSDASSWTGFTFSPGSEKMIFSKGVGPFNRYNPSNLYSFNLADQSMIQLTDTANISEESPLWSPDGKLLAYAAFTDVDLDNGKKGQSAIKVQDATGSSSTLDVPIYSSINQLAWTPDSQALLFKAHYDDDAGLYLIRITNGDQVQKVLSVEQVRGGISEVSWSPDGSYIALTTVGVPGQNDLRIFTPQELGLSEFTIVPGTPKP